MKEVADLAARRHGLPSHTEAGLGALRAMRLRAELTKRLEREKFYLDPDVTLSGLAKRIGCSAEQLSIVIEKQMSTSFEDIMDMHRVEHAKALLKDAGDDPNVVLHAASGSGFRSVEEFNRKFTEVVGLKPADFCLHGGQAGTLH